MKTKRGAAVALASVVLLGLPGPILAANSEAREETALQGTKLSLWRGQVSAIPPRPLWLLA
jgi:hypothetical protein